MKSFRDAVDYYEAVIDEIRSSENNQNKRLLVQVYNDMAKIGIFNRYLIFSKVEMANLNLNFDAIRTG